MFRLFLALCVFFTQGLFAHAAELSFWKDRRRFVQARSNVGNALAPDSLRVFQELPAASARSPLIQNANPWTEILVRGKGLMDPFKPNSKNFDEPSIVSGLK